MYAIEFLPSAARALSKVDRRVQLRIASSIDRLAQDPRAHGALKLRGSSEMWRGRIGDHRVLYQIDDDSMVVTVVSVGHRSSVYR
jgi:mRNA interferase RelE/StbE